MNIAKFLINTAISLGSGAVAKAAIQHVMSGYSANTIMKVAVKTTEVAAGVALGSVINKHANEVIDEIDESIKEIKKNIKK